MATIGKLKEGQILWGLVSVGVGNTTIRRKALYDYRVVEIDLDNRKVLASWNGNSPRWYTEAHVKKWRVNKPEPKGKDVLGHARY